DNEERPGAENVYQRLAILHALRGELGAARAALDRMTGWQQSDDVEVNGEHAAAAISVALAEGRPQDALDIGRRMLGPAIETLGASNEVVRMAWPETLRAALETGQIEEAQALLALLAQRPPGHVPPYLDAQLARGRALIAAAEGRHETVQADFTAAIDGLRELGYPYWLAVAQADLAAWLVGQGQATEATVLLEEATTTFRSLGAAPALARALQLVDAPTSAAAS
ncbi:MAG: hypothetical protein QOF12_2226, partial [Solirubrobacteraceae bacterium]|nr:hypothetical protein [Solirubrobacteraceae bacterium]